MLRTAVGNREPAQRRLEPKGPRLLRRAAEGMRLVEDSLDIETCEGAGTIGLELVDTPPSFDAVLIALGGGPWQPASVTC